MRIAVCISGQPRAYDKGYEYLKRNLLDHYDCDIFIHTWNNKVYDVKDVVSLYKPVSYISEDPPFSFEHLNNKYVHTPNAKEWPAATTVYALYSVFKSCLLKIQHEVITTSYDWVIKTRFDYALNGRIAFEQLDKSKLYIPNCRMVPSRDFGNDQFAFGSSSVLTEYMSTFLYMDQFYNAGCTMIGEDMLSANLRRSGLIGDRLVYVDMRNPFPPGKYNGTPHSLIRDDTELWKAL